MDSSRLYITCLAAVLFWEFLSTISLEWRFIWKPIFKRNDLEIKRTRGTGLIALFSFVVVRYLTLAVFSTQVAALFMDWSTEKCGTVIGELHENRFEWPTPSDDDERLMSSRITLFFSVSSPSTTIYYFDSLSIILCCFGDHGSYRSPRSQSRCSVGLGSSNPCLSSPHLHFASGLPLLLGSWSKSLPGISLLCWWFFQSSRALPLLGLTDDLRSAVGHLDDQ